MDLTKAKLWFVTLAFALFVLFAISVFHENDREWKKYQEHYMAMEMDRGVERDYSVKIRQIWNPQMSRTDRCITCHVAMEDMDVQVPYTQNPYKSHPKVEMMKKHPTAKIGCTVCHEGQGHATTVETAHGWVEAWDFPMHRQRGGVSFIQSSCTKCHAPDQLPEGAEQLMAGRALWDKNGCKACHMVKEIQSDGGNQGPELTGIGSKTESEFSNTHSYQHVEAISEYEHTTKYEWLYQHFKEPIKVTPDNPHTPEFDGTIMPNFRLTDTEAKLLTQWVYSFRDVAKENIPAQWIAHTPGKYSVVKPAGAKAQPVRKAAGK